MNIPPDQIEAWHAMTGAEPGTLTSELNDIVREMCERLRLDERDAMRLLQEWWADARDDVTRAPLRSLAHGYNRPRLWVMLLWIDRHGLPE